LFYLIKYYIVCPQNDAQIQVVVTTTLRVRIDYIYSHFNYRLTGVHLANFEKKLVALFLKYK